MFVWIGMSNFQSKLITEIRLFYEKILCRQFQSQYQSLSTCCHTVLMLGLEIACS